MQTLAQPLQTFVSSFTNNASTFFFSVLLFAYYHLEHKFSCSCDAEDNFCWTYMCVPSVVIAAMMLVTDSQFVRLVRLADALPCGFPCVCCLRVVKAVCVGLMWVAAVLIDAEWSVCCRNPNVRDVADFQCRHGKDLHGGTPITTIADMKRNSTYWGVAVLMGSIVVICVLSVQRCYTDSCCLDCCRTDVQSLILEVGEDTVLMAKKEKLQEMIRDKVISDIAKGDWDMGSRPIEEVIKQVEREQNERSRGRGVKPTEEIQMESKQ